jgi:hypothetical protein
VRNLGTGCIAETGEGGLRGGGGTGFEVLYTFFCLFHVDNSVGFNQFLQKF